MSLARSLLFIATLTILLIAPVTLIAAQITSDQIPEDLAQWQNWVLFDQPDRACTPLWNHGIKPREGEQQQRRCLWSGQLNIDINNNGGSFEQYWELDRDGWIVLPGSSQFWPQQVKLDDNTAQVMRSSTQLIASVGDVAIGKNRPLVYAKAGKHLIRGIFNWQQPPQNLPIAPHSAIVKLRRNGVSIYQPQLERNGILWLHGTDNSNTNNTQDQAHFQIFRLITDSIPLQLTTNIQLEISGKERELHTEPILPDGFVPLAISSPLPARLESNGSLRIQVKPGRWTIELTTRHLGALDSITMPDVKPPWAQQEVWSVQTRSDLRVVTVEGGKSIDPAQTAMPARWKQLPAYVMQPHQQLKLITRKRGNDDPVAQQIKLQRTLWLDFGGEGYTVKDFISGQLSSRSRLEAGSKLDLGRVSINGKNQFITRLAPQSPAGVEIRQSHINIEAESRIEVGADQQLAAVGWAFNPSSLQTQLNLPPGWRLLEAVGPDSASSTWLRSWSLLDIFIVLVLALSFGRLWGPLSGLGALLGLAIIYHEPHAPQLAWLNVLIPIALLRVLPDGRLHQFTRWYRNTGMLALLVLCLFFSVQQIRTAIYPQLEPSPSRHQHYNGVTDTMTDETLSQSEARMSKVATRAMNIGRAATGLSANKNSWQQPLPQYDPDLKIQTGPGVPKWHWRTVALRWNGPVNADQLLKLYLLPPTATRLLLLSGVLLMLLMFLRLFSAGSLPRWKRERADISATAMLVIVIGTTLLMLLPASSAQAEFPSPELLEQLQQRLLQPDSCAPNCIALNKMEINADQKLLRLRLTYHCQNERAVPLPLSTKQLHLHSARLDQSDQTALYRDGQGKLWAKIPAGIHTLELYANLPEQLQRLQLPMPMVAGVVHISAANWKVTGAQDGHSSHGSIDLTRRATTTTTQLQPNEIPPFVEVQREIYLGFDWQVRTTVRRISQSGNAILVQIPLLPDEHVISQGIKVDGQQIQISLAPEARSFSWNSSFGKTSQLELLAAASNNFSEVWQLRTKPIWHVTSSGIPVIHHYQHGHWQPQWRPWPGEKLTLTITRPSGTTGQQVTIDNSQLTLTPGERSTEAILTLQLRSSHGSEHTITIPDNAALSKVLINGQPQPIKQQQRLVKVPLVPGLQTIELRWQQPRGVELITSTPQIHLGGTSVNSKMALKLPHNRWVLFAGGPVLGPAVLFWGVLIVIIVLSFILARLANTPLRWWHWMLLFAGLSQASFPALIPVAAWLLLLSLRKQWSDHLDSPWSFNLTQLTLIVLTFVALATIIGAIQQGLLGVPEMQVTGNHSSAWDLRWYQDRCSGFLPKAWALSVPMYIYRIFMLLWALWLALALLKWLHWGWDCYSTGGIWRQLPRRQQIKRKLKQPKDQDHQ